jgi:hypothetical protein
VVWASLRQSLLIFRLPRFSRLIKTSLGFDINTSDISIPAMRQWARGVYEHGDGDKNPEVVVCRESVKRVWYSKRW